MAVVIDIYIVLQLYYRVHFTGKETEVQIAKQLAQATAGSTLEAGLKSRQGSPLLTTSLHCRLQLGKRCAAVAAAQS